MLRRGPRLKPLIGTINASTIEAALRPHCKKWAKGDHVPGRAPLDPVGMVLALVIMLVREWSPADLVDFLAKRPEWLRFLCLDHVPDDSTWSKLLGRVPAKTLDAILSGIVNDLRRRRFLRFTVAAADSSFVAACHWDPDAAWGYARPEDRRSACRRAWSGAVPWTGRGRLRKALGRRGEEKGWAGESGASPTTPIVQRAPLKGLYQDEDKNVRLIDPLRSMEAMRGASALAPALHRASVEPAFQTATGPGAVALSANPRG